MAYDAMSVENGRDMLIERHFRRGAGCLQGNSRSYKEQPYNNCPSANQSERHIEPYWQVSLADREIVGVEQSSVATRTLGPSRWSSPLSIWLMPFAASLIFWSDF
jgi:hypothetical protein